MGRRGRHEKCEGARPTKTLTEGRRGETNRHHNLGRARGFGQEKCSANAQETGSSVPRIGRTFGPGRFVARCGVEDGRKETFVAERTTGANEKGQ